MDSRGVIQNVARAQQINSFSGIRYGNITPTDMDGLIEYNNKAYVIFEVKYRDKKLPFGQRLAIQRMVDDLSLGGKKVIALIIEHCVDNTAEQIDIAGCEVRELYLSNEKQWRPPHKRIRVKTLIDLFITKIVGDPF